MRLPRIHLDRELSPGQTLDLDGQAANHVGRVLRRRTGQKLVLFDGRGKRCEAVITAARRRCVRVCVERCAPCSLESPLAITLAQAMCRAEKMDWVLQKGTELGVAAFMPVYTRRSVARPDEKNHARKMARWRAVIAHACEQCGRNRLPRLHPPDTLDAVLAMPTAAACFYLHPSAEARLKDLKPADNIVFAVGPEGGFAQRELRALTAAGFTGLNMGPRILRVETAALATVDAINSLWGDA